MHNLWYTTKDSGVLFIFITFSLAIILDLLHLLNDVQKNRHIFN